VVNKSVSEQEYESEANHLFGLIDQLLQSTNDGRLYPGMKAGCRQQIDDAETDPFQLSHIIQNLLNAAIEHVHAIAAVVRKAGLLHNSPPFTLGRAAVECAGTAYWLLEPADQSQRLRRHVTVVSQDTFDYEQVTNRLNDSLADRASDEQPDFQWRRDVVKRIKAKHHLTSVPPKLNTALMLQEVDAALAKERRTDDKSVVEMMELYWRTASGFGHGRQWATLNALERSQVIPVGDGTAQLKISSTMSRVFWGVSCAYQLIDRSLSLFYKALGHDQVQLDLHELRERAEDGKRPND
jgi:hypothetical protein